MRIRTAIVSTMLGALMSGGLFISGASADYNAVPAGDVQFAQCLVYSAKVYEGGRAASPIPGQDKQTAWCTCMWNETPEDFKGDLAKFSETAKGASMNKMCEKYADWG